MANFINYVKAKVLSIKETDAFFLASFEKLQGTAPSDETLDRLNALEANMTRLKQDLVRSSFEVSDFNANDPISSRFLCPRRHLFTLRTQPKPPCNAGYTVEET